MNVEDCLTVIGRDAAWIWIVEKFIATGPHCPWCKESVRTDRAISSFFELRRTWCKECERTFTPTVGTPIHETSWQPEEFLQFMILSLSGRSSVEIAQHLGKSASTVRDMLAKVELLLSESPTMVSEASTA
jgi:transposase-like protein